jgi:tetrahydromethanopterin S-methyltransferase subunit B
VWFNNEYMTKQVCRCCYFVTEYNVFSFVFTLTPVQLTMNTWPNRVSLLLFCYWIYCIFFCVHINPGAVNNEYMTKQECRCCYFVTEYNVFSFVFTLTPAQLTMNTWPNRCVAVAILLLNILYFLLFTH